VNAKRSLVSIALIATMSAAIAVDSTGAVAGAVAGAAAQRPAAAGAAMDHLFRPGVKPITVKKYGSVLADRAGTTLYLLSTEAGGRLHCTSSACLTNWPPLLVSKGVKVEIGAGVKGKIGTVARSATTRQVTFNGYPVYGFIGDSGKGQANGEKIVAFGGTWYMLRPSARTGSTTAVK
jgi:predicted lipoprotein with Yx(FWY)xxD motif